MAVLWIQSWDEGLLRLGQRVLNSEVLAQLMIFFTRLGDKGLLWIVLTVLLLLHPKTRRGGVLLAVSLVMTAVLGNLVLKPLAGRERPFLAMEEVRLLISPPGGFSFPSGHAGSSFAAAMALHQAFGKRGTWAFLPAGMVAVSRVCLGVHYPTDVVVGALLGMVIAVLAAWILRHWRQLKERDRA